MNKLGAYHSSHHQWLHSEPPRNSGLEVIGDVPWSTHSCVLYTSGEELLEILVPYFAQGLAANEFCIWVTSDPLSADMARAALRTAAPQLDAHIARGQIDIRNYDRWYVRDGRIDVDRSLRELTEKLVAARELGFDGLRSAGNLWIEIPWKGFMRYEAMLDRVVELKRIIALCAYPLDKCSIREIFDVIANHDFALLKEDGRWRPVRGFGRRRMERALRESEARQATIIDAFKDAIIAFDERGVIQSINQAGVAMFGYEREEIIGQDIGMLAPGLQGMASVMSLETEAEARRKDNSSFPIEMSVTETKHENSRLFVACLRDLSDKRRAEARLKKLHIERLAAIGGMAAGLAHELNQPLSANAAYLRAARRLLQMPSDQRRTSVEETLDKAAEQIMRAGRIISSLRALAADGEPDKLIHSLHDLIRKACGFLAGSLKEANIQTSLKLSAEKDAVLADAVQIQQVLTNLINNAIEGMGASAKRELTISTSLPEQDIIQVNVADTGSGLIDEVKDRLFEPSVTTKDSGMGLGLPMSRMIIEAHHGKIWAHPDPEIGAVFSFTLPLAVANDALGSLASGDEDNSAR